MNPNNWHPDLNRLREIGEWAALGFYEAIEEPWPRAYGRAYRRLYENMEIVISEDRYLIPAEPLPRSKTRETHDFWTATSLICDHNHNVGLRWNPSVAEEKKRQFPRHAAFIDGLTQDLDYRLFQSKTGGYFGGYTHANPDIRRVVGEGFLAMEAELDGQLSALEQAGAEADPEALNLLRALKDFTIGVYAFHSRTAEALQRAAEAATGARKVKLALIATSFRNGFVKPAQTFLEGLLAVNLTWMLDGCDSIGRVDQVLGGLFEQDLRSGVLDRPFAQQLFDEWWCNFERMNGWNLQIGGYTPEGRDGCNALTREFILACGRNHYRRPNVAFRITRETPEEYLVEALEALREGSGRPALYNDDLYVEALSKMDLGLTPEDAREIGFGGCTETMIAGLSNVGSLEGEINLAKALELALHDGWDPVAKQQAGPHTGRFEGMKTFGQFEAALRRQIQYLTDAFVARDKEQLRNRFHRGDPKMPRTFFTRDCVKNRKSFEAGGARYNWAVVSYQGIANLIDSLAAIRLCVYQKKQISRPQLLEALLADFRGSEKIRKILQAAPKFGNDDACVDHPGRDIIRFAWETLYAHATPRGGRYLPSCILFTTYRGAGLQVGATPDGRKAFTPLVDSVGAFPGRDTEGPTALLNSVAKLPLALAAGTPVLNVRFQKSILTGKAGLGKVAALIRSFFAQGGMQVQVSVLNKAEMLAAQKEPERHQGLIVRIGGYSEYFTKLDQELQNSVIARTEHAT